MSKRITARKAAMAAAIGVLSTILGAPEADARPLQIIHTNDLHSHLNRSRDPSRGGYAAIKAVIDRLKGDARAQGIETLTLDAGDFSEDSEYYLAGQGIEAWRAMEAMGYDAVTIGNHDWLAGPYYLDKVVGEAKPSFAFLGANFIFTWDSKNLVKYMKQQLEVVKAGARIAVYGLTTDDIEYSWLAGDGFVYKPSYTAMEDLPALRRRNDYIIALTHMGVAADKDLVRRTAGIDLVVGGHSHTALKWPEEAVDKRGRTVPIVQTGMHGMSVGDLLVDVEPGKPLQILRYRLVPVPSDGPKDETMSRVVASARQHLDDDYGADWLREVVGYSDVPLLNAYYQDGPTAWSEFVGEAIREAGNADAAIDVVQFEGFDQPAGPITREQLFVLYPRIFEFSKRYGWTVWTTYVNGLVIKTALEQVLKGGEPISTSGIEYDMSPSGKLSNIRIGGKPLNTLKSYKIALPEGVIRGAFGISKYLKVVFRKAHDTGTPIWFATEAKLRREGVIKDRVR